MYHKVQGGLSDYRIMVVPDVHLRASGYKTRNNYVDEILFYLNKLADIAIFEGIDRLVFIGDLFDDGFKGANSGIIMLKLIGILEKLENEGIAIDSLMGNHEKHSIMKGCPWFTMCDIQSERLKQELDTIAYNYRIYSSKLKAYDGIIVNDKIQIDYFHFSDINKDYKCERFDGIEKRIGIYHDALVSKQVKYLLNSTNYQALINNIGTKRVIDLDSIFEDMDYAQIGDIHTRIGEFSIGNCVCDITGSIGRTNSSEMQRHSYVDIPIYNINGNNISKEHIKFELLDTEQIYNKEEIKKSKDKREYIKSFKQHLENASYSTDTTEIVYSICKDDRLAEYCLNAINNSQNTIDNKIDSLQAKYAYLY